jgi:hypothetical protein
MDRHHIIATAATRDVTPIFTSIGMIATDVIWILTIL